MKLVTLSVLIHIITGSPCDFPPKPLAGSFKLIKDNNNKTGACEFSCQKGFIEVGEPSLGCHDGDWDYSDFFCATNVAVNKPCFYNSNSTLSASKLAVDGEVDSSSHYKCDQIDETNKIWTVDLQEAVNVRAIKVVTHSEGSEARNIEVKYQMELMY